MQSVLQGLEPKKLWEFFDVMMSVPRESGNEAAVMAKLQEMAGDAGLESKRDAVGNLVVYAPATEGYENAPTVVLQGHVDMVCVKNSDTSFDFATDGIRAVRDGDWIKADGTSLGADNAIGVAASFAAALNPKARRGPLEILLTIEEETGLVGATHLDESLIHGRILFNLDSEEMGILYMGCAGGGGVDSNLPIAWEDVPGGMFGARLSVKGLRGGHSGCDVHENRANGIKLLARALHALKGVDYSLADLHGGEKHNAIPREAFAAIALRSGDLTKAKDIAAQLQSDFLVEYPEDANLTISVEETDMPGRVFQARSRDAAIDMLLAFPSGVISMHRLMEGLVETSSNLALAHVKGDILSTHNSPRSSNEISLQGILAQIEAAARLAGATNESEEPYPGWDPNPSSQILGLVAEVYEDLFGMPPERKAIHAGLECGIIGKNFDGMDMVSFGPDINSPHSPDECVNIETVEKFYLLLEASLERIAMGGY